MQGHYNAKDERCHFFQKEGNSINPNDGLFLFFEHCDDKLDNKNDNM